MLSPGAGGSCQVTSASLAASGLYLVVGVAHGIGKLHRLTGGAPVEQHFPEHGAEVIQCAGTVLHPGAVTVVAACAVQGGGDLGPLEAVVEYSPQVGERDVTVTDLHGAVDGVDVGANNERPPSRSRCIASGSAAASRAMTGSKKRIGPGGSSENVEDLDYGHALIAVGVVPSREQGDRWCEANCDVGLRSLDSLPWCSWRSVAPRRLRRRRRRRRRWRRPAASSLDRLRTRAIRAPMRPTCLFLMSARRDGRCRPQHRIPRCRRRAG